MAEYWQTMHLRGQQTIGVWGTFSAAFQVGALTLTEHTADVALILTHVNDRDVQQDVLDDAMLARDANFDLIHDIAVRVPQLIDATLEDSDPLNNDLDDIFGVNPDSQHGSMERSRRIISLWHRVNAKRAAMTPALPALLLGSTSVADLTTAVANHPGLMQIVENERSELSQTKSQLQTTARRVDRNNKRWYGAWGTNFAVGSPEHLAMLSQITTETGTIAPSAQEILLLTQTGLSVHVSYVSGGGNHATSLLLQWQVEGTDPDFAHDTAVILTGQTVGPFPAAATLHFRVRAANSAGVTDSAVQDITLT